MHFLKTQLFHYALFQKAEPNSPIVPPSYLLSFIFSINLVLPLLLCVISPTSTVTNEPRMGASLLRLHFYDCFVNASHLSLSLSHMNALFLELTEIFKLYV